MARPLFEQYKDALRRGHLALLEDELDAALTAYQEAASLVPDRPLPHASIGSVLERLGRSEEALGAYDRAVALAPGEAIYSVPRDAIAAAMGEEAGVAVAEPAPAAAPEPERGAGPEPASALEPVPEPAPAREPSARRAVAAASDDDTEMVALQAMRAALDPSGDGGAGAPAKPADEPEVPASDGRWPAIDLPSPPPAPLAGPPPDPALLQAEAEAFIDAGDEAAARDPLLLAVAVHRDAGRLDAAIDACLQLLAITPGDPHVHLAIANLQLDREWRSVATEKIELLLRLTSLSGDAQAEADVHLLAAERLRDESPARLDARKRGLPAA